MPHKALITQKTVLFLSGMDLTYFCKKKNILMILFKDFFIDCKLWLSPFYKAVP